MKRSPQQRMAGQKVYATVLICASLLLGLSSCQRKAPGPDECVAFAKVWAQRDKVSLGRALVGEDSFDDLVRDCLTRPFDRALVECALSGASPRRCRADYLRRVEQQREARSH